MNGIFGAQGGTPDSPLPYQDQKGLLASAWTEENTLAFIIISGQPAKRKQFVAPI